MTDAWLRGLLTLPFALAIGSFMTVVTDRMPQGESVVSPRSRCPSCGAEIAPRDNVPVLSWLLLRGRCRSCGHPHLRRVPAHRARHRGPHRGRHGRVRPHLGRRDGGAAALDDARHLHHRHPAPDHPEPPDVPVADRLPRLHRGGVAVPRAGPTPRGPASGFLLFGGSLFLVAAHQPRDGDGRREARRPDRPGARRDRPALRGRGGRRRRSCWAGSGASPPSCWGAGARAPSRSAPTSRWARSWPPSSTSPIASWYIDRFLTHPGHPQARPPARRGA